MNIPFILELDSLNKSGEKKNLNAQMNGRPNLMFCVPISKTP
jgi:hypothetical protein